MTLPAFGDKKGAVIPAFDIFRIDIEHGHLTWCSAAVTQDEAEAKARALAEFERCSYIIFSQETGNVKFISPRPPD